MNYISPKGETLLKELLNERSINELTELLKIGESPNIAFFVSQSNVLTPLEFFLKSNLYREKKNSVDSKVIELLLCYGAQPSNDMFTEKGKNLIENLNMKFLKFFVIFSYKKTMDFYFFF